MKTSVERVDSSSAALSPLRGLSEAGRERTASQLLRAVPWDRKPPLPDPAKASAKEFFAALRNR